MGIFLNNCLPLLLTTASVQVEEFLQKTKSITYGGDGPITKEVFNDAKIIGDHFAKTPQK
ncbi:MAG: hypothetical protein ACREOZ_00510 [Gloeomargaritales cyanobacterium]